MVISARGSRCSTITTIFCQFGSRIDHCIHGRIGKKCECIAFDIACCPVDAMFRSSDRIICCQLSKFTHLKEKDIGIVCEDFLKHAFLRCFYKQTCFVRFGDLLTVEEVEGGKQCGHYGMVKMGATP